MEYREVDFNGNPHMVCGVCESIIGHGCPDFDPCDCEGSDTHHEDDCEQCLDYEWHGR